MPNDRECDDDCIALYMLAIIIALFIILVLLESILCVSVPKSIPEPVPNAVPVANTPVVEQGSFAEGAGPTSDTCVLFGGEPDLVNPGLMFDQHPLIEFCVTNCVEYDDAINRAAIEDAELTKKIAAEPDNSIWPMRQQYYTIYLDALHAVGAQIGC
jgi:hypothetical protein